MRHTPEQVAKARQMYLGGEPVARIRKVCDMSEGTLYYWLDGGPKDGDRQLEPLPRRSRGTRVPRRRRRMSGDRIAVVSRAWRTAEAQVRDIEERLMRNQQQPDERERDTRMLAVLAKTLRELTALDERRKTPRADEDDDDGPRDIDEFRRELARRMDALVASRAGGGVPGERQGE